MSSLAIFNDAKALALIKRTVAKDANDEEFQQFIHICKAVNLDPLRRQIYLFIFGRKSKNPADRRMTVVTGIDGYRSISARSGDYRPASTAPLIEYDTKLKCDANPLGIVRAEVTLYKHSHGEWFPVVGQAYYDEFAPIKTEIPFDLVDTGETWPDGNPKKKKVPIKGAKATSILDPDKTGWVKSPRNQIAKCAEAQAHRMGWPNDFAGLYVAEELDRTHTLDLTATELAEAGEQERRLEIIGGGKRILVDWMDGEALTPVPVGKLADSAIAFIRAHKDEPSSILQWQERNRHGLQEFWAMDKDSALALKQEIEKATAA